MKRQVLFFHLFNDFSGSPRVLNATMDALSDDFQCVLYLGSDGPGVLDSNKIAKKLYWYKRFKMKTLTLISYLMSQFHLFFILFATKEISKDAVIYVNTLLPFSAMIWGKLTKRTVIVHVHEVSIKPMLLRWFLTKCASKCANLIIWVSHDHLSRLPIECDEKAIIYNSVDLRLQKKCDSCLAKASDEHSKTFNVLMLASLRSYKGIWEFINVCTQLKQINDIKFDLVLNDTDLAIDEFGEATNALELNLNVHKRTDQPEIFYQNADLVMNLSRVDQWVETFGLTIIEAMYFSVPVIAPPIGGCAEIVTNGIDGFLIDSRNINELSQKVMFLYEHPDIWKVMSRNAKDKANAFTYAQYSSNVRALLNKN